MQSFILKGVKSKRSSIKTAFLQPLSFLDMVVQYRGNRDLQIIREARPAFVINTIPYEVQKSSIAMFATELIYKTVKEEEANEALFSFLHSFIQYLDAASAGLGNLPLYFMVEMSRFLGFFPQEEGGENAMYFRLEEGIFSREGGTEDSIIAPPASQYLRQLMDLEMEDPDILKIPVAVRHELMQKMIYYYRLHSDNFHGLRSYEILREVMRK